MNIAPTAQPMLFWILFSVHWVVLAFLAVGVLVGFIMAMSVTFLLPAIWQTAGLAFAHERKRSALIGQANVVLVTLGIVDVCAVWIFA
ncbi:hypothetical protein ASE85_20200 [Sphingobium sp. Leaf26]|uniref:hypothetical protein n=1 Tax=Sphingobium sp. Leaf26 TaxID=1735693 RepID=UPI000701CEC4|nr:hypothetical protein [Sphingobium sp. Leaf26]KQN05386.1 hypothetical protein ASE85_20200 [Sphingobium sp. Leaf26]